MCVLSYLNQLTILRIPRRFCSRIPNPLRKVTLTLHSNFVLLIKYESCTTISTLQIFSLVGPLDSAWVGGLVTSITEQHSTSPNDTWTFLSIYAINSMILWKLTSICLVLAWYTWFFAKSIILWLLLCNWTSPCSMPSSFTNHVNHITSLLVYATAMYSVSIVDIAIRDSIMDFQQIGPSPKVKTYSIVDLLSSRSLA